MGGAVFEFPMSPSKALLGKASVPQLSLISRLTGRAGRADSLEARLVRLLQPFCIQMLSDFRRWLEQSVTTPWEATQSVIESYLSLIKPSDVSMYCRAPD